MTAAEAIRHAEEAGLTLRADPAGLRVSGPKPARVALLPLLRPLTAEILRLLTPENSAAEAEPATTTVRCDECGRPAWLALVERDGIRRCVQCLSGRTALQRRGVPA